MFPATMNRYFFLPCDTDGDIERETENVCMEEIEWMVKYKVDLLEENVCF